MQEFKPGWLATASTGEPATFQLYRGHGSNIVSCTRSLRLDGDHVQFAGIAVVAACCQNTTSHREYER